MLKYIVLILLIATQSGLCTEKIREIHVVSEALEELSQTDGSGLYFDLVRKIYEPMGIKLNTTIFPYIRSINAVRQKKSDFWLGSYLNEVDYASYPKWPYDFDQIFEVFLDDSEDMQSAIEEEDFNMQGYSIVDIAKLFLFPAFRNDARGQKLADLWDKRLLQLQQNGELSELFTQYEYSPDEIKEINTYRQQ